MDTAKRIATLLLSILLFFGLIVVHLMRKSNEQKTSLELRSVQERIYELEQEKKELEARLVILEGEAELEAAEESEPEAIPEIEESQLIEPKQAVVCIVDATEDFFQDTYPLLRELGISGIIVLKDGRLPGDTGNGMISVRNFVKMQEDGWKYAIAIPVNQDMEKWEKEINEYRRRLRARVGAEPEGYCFFEPAPRGWQEVISKETYSFVLTREQLSEAEGEYITLLPYGDESLTERLSKMEGFCGLEMQGVTSDDMELALRYDAATVQQLINSEIVKLKSLDQLEPISLDVVEEQATAPDEAEQVDNIEPSEQDRIYDRILEIEEEIQQLYY